MNFFKQNQIQAVWFDAFWTLIDDSKRPKFNLARIFKKYWLNLKETNLIVKQYSQNPEKYYQELFDYLFQKEWKWRSYKKDVSDKDKKIILENYYQEIESYSLRPQTDEFLEKIKSQVDSIFLISNLSSIYVNKVEELLKNHNFLFKIYSCDVWLQKTIKNTEIFDLSYEKLKENWTIVKRNKILFSWDKKSNDEIAPKNAWFQAINIDKFRNIILNTN